MKIGDRIMLIEMVRDPDPILPGAQGTIQDVCKYTGWVQVWIQWDNGRTVALCIPPDSARVIYEAG